MMQDLHFITKLVIGFGAVALAVGVVFAVLILHHLIRRWEIKMRGFGE